MPKLPGLRVHTGGVTCPAKNVGSMNQTEGVEMGATICSEFHSTLRSISEGWRLIWP